MASDVFRTVNATVYFKDIKSIDNETQTIYAHDTRTFIYSAAIWREFKTQYNTWKLEQEKMVKDTFRIRNYDYPLSEVVGFNQEEFIVSFERKYEKLTQQQFGDFLIVYGEWIKQRKEPVNYPDGWYAAKGTKGLYRVFRLKNNVIHHPKHKNVNNLKISDPQVVWKDIQRIDVMSDEFVELFKETIT